MSRIGTAAPSLAALWRRAATEQSGQPLRLDVASAFPGSPPVSGGVSRETAANNGADRAFRENDAIRNRFSFLQ